MLCAAAALLHLQDAYTLASLHILDVKKDSASAEESLKIYSDLLQGIMDT